jgi:hypothetical protein
MLEILFADTHSKSGVEASDDKDYFEEEVRAQKNVLGLGIQHNKH